MPSLIGDFVKDNSEDLHDKHELDLLSYAKKLRLSADPLMEIGIRTINSSDAPALEIPYRRRDGTEVGRRIRRCLENMGRVEWSIDNSTSGEPIYLVVPFTERAVAKAAGARRDTKAKAWYIPPDTDPTPFAKWSRLRCLYGLDHAPATGQPVFLCCDEPTCHVIWQQGFDAIGMCDAGDYFPERDDHELELYDVTALIPPDESGALLMKRLSLSRIRHAIKVVELDVFAAIATDADIRTLLQLAQEDWRYLNEVLDEKPHLGARSEILLKSGEQPRVVHAALKVIRGREMLYERGGELVRLCGDIVVPVEEFWLSDFLGRCCIFYREKSDRNGELLRYEVDTPAWLCKTITKKRGERGLQELLSIITAPTLRPDGSLLDRPGFDDATGLLLRPGQWPKVPDHPTRDALTKAWRTLWKPFAEFPYVSGDDRAVTVAALFTAVIRRILPRAPAFSIDAPTPASGKTLLATCIAELAGGKVAVFPECREEEELRKRLLSGLRENLPSFLLDNIKGQFKSSALEAFLTDDYYSD